MHEVISLKKRKKEKKKKGDGICMKYLGVKCPHGQLCGGYFHRINFVHGYVLANTVGRIFVGLYNSK